MLLAHQGRHLLEMGEEWTTFRQGFSWNPNPKREKLKIRGSTSLKKLHLTRVFRFIPLQSPACATKDKVPQEMDQKKQTLGKRAEALHSQ